MQCPLLTQSGHCWAPHSARKMTERTGRDNIIVCLVTFGDGMPDPYASIAAADLAQRWTRALTQYCEARHGRSLFEIAVTLVPFTALWAVAWAAVHFGYWELSFLLGVPAAGFLVRLFMIQHDCGHGSFFRCRLANDWMGRFLSVLTLTPYDDWRRAHAVHHANSGHLDRRGVGDIGTLTVREFQALAFWGRLRYRLYRHPFVCSVSALPIFSSCGSGCQLVRCAAAGWHGLAQWRPISRSQSWSLRWVGSSASAHSFSCICR